MGRFLVFIAVALGVLIVFSLTRRQQRVDAAVRGLVRRALESHGAARCVAAIAVLRHLRDLAQPETVAGAWDAIELPLLQSLPDCPPDYKAALREALEDVAARCAKRDVARRVMVMRDALVQV